MSPLISQANSPTRQIRVTAKYSTLFSVKEIIRILYLPSRSVKRQISDTTLAVQIKRLYFCLSFNLLTR